MEIKPFAVSSHIQVVEGRLVLSDRGHPVQERPDRPSPLGHLSFLSCQAVPKIKQE